MQYSNKEIASLFDELASLMELHGENSFKIRAYQFAYPVLKKLDISLYDYSEEELSQIKGVGKAISEKITVALQTGTFPTLETYRQKTPDGVREMLEIGGLGPKKVLALWKELEITSIGELQYACLENRITLLKGFGAKTQNDILQKLEYYVSNKESFLWAEGERILQPILNHFKEYYPNERLEPTGDFRRQLPTLSEVELLTTAFPDTAFIEKQQWQVTLDNDTTLHLKTPNGYRINFIKTPAEIFEPQLFITTGGNNLLDGLATTQGNTEMEIFERNNLPYIIPALRDLDIEHAKSKTNLITTAAIKGVIHNHSTYSDGSNTLREMATACIQRGYEYLVISDHSQSAFYAQGMKPEKVLEQWKEIDTLNQELAPFHIFKGIESDILHSGSLDYEDALLKGFEVVIASVHSGLQMDIVKATDRILKAIHHPSTRILGHPTGRLLLSRKGYPLDFDTIIAACAAQNVVIELNANPLRLDMDWTLIPKALEKGVKIAINPDAHNTRGIDDIRYGVLVAQKGGLEVNECLNTLSLKEFEHWVNEKF